MKKKIFYRNSECPQYELCLAKVAFLPYGGGRFHCNGCANENVHRDPFSLGWREVFGCIKLLHHIFQTDYARRGPRDTNQFEDDAEDALDDHFVSECVDYFESEFEIDDSLF